ncbi:hypothetical protein BH09ACT12_BH09ACT12_08540 [soil metagenome]
MSDAPGDPYRPPGQPEPGSSGDDTEPIWGSAATGEEPPAPHYPPYTPPQATPPPNPPSSPQPNPYGQPYAPPPAQHYPPAPGQSGYPPAPYGYGPPAPGLYGAPGWGVDAYGQPYSDKTKTTSGLLQLLLPLVTVCGVGRLYAGHIGIGLLQLLGFYVSLCGLGWLGIGFVIAGGIWLWTVIDGIVMLSGQPRDGQGRLMR